MGPINSRCISVFFDIQSGSAICNFKTYLSSSRPTISLFSGIFEVRFFLLILIRTINCSIVEATGLQTIACTTKSKCLQLRRKDAPENISVPNKTGQTLDTNQQKRNFIIPSCLSFVKQRTLYEPILFKSDKILREEDIQPMFDFIETARP